MDRPSPRKQVGPVDPGDRRERLQVLYKTERLGYHPVPTIHRERGFRFIVYFGDHPPPHLHVWKAGTEAKVAIGDSRTAPRVIDPGEMPTRDVRRAVRIVERNQFEFLTEWKRYHG